MNLILNLRKRLLLLLCLFLLGFFITGVISALVMRVFGPSTPALRIVMVIQDLLVFMAPAVITAVMVTRRSAELLCIDRGISLQPLLLGILALVASIPAMNFIIWLNENVPLPDDVYKVLMAMEESANDNVQALFGSHDVGNLIVTILIVGVLAGLSEELLFRGGLQRLLITGGINPHAAIWVTAAMFSLLHFQFFGFVPRMLLGAFFGYTLYWTRTLWIPIILHTFNNSLYVFFQWQNYDSPDPSPIDALGSGSDFLIVAISALITAASLLLLKRNSKKQRIKD